MKVLLYLGLLTQLVLGTRLQKYIRSTLATLTTSITVCLNFCDVSSADMLLFPLQQRLKNNIVLIRAGESFADSRHEIQTNPVKKLRQDNALTFKGREQIIEAGKYLESLNFQPSYIWVSNTERAYESAVVLAREIQLGQNRIVPEFSFLDARALGAYEGKDDELTMKEIHKNDEEIGIQYRPPQNTDGTPSDSVATVLVRMNQLVSTIESMYSGENVVIISPDSEILSVLQAAMSSENPDDSLRHHFQYTYNNGEARLLSPFIKPSDKHITGLTLDEADSNSRMMKALLVRGNYKLKEDDKNIIRDWYSLYQLSLKNNNQ